MADLKAGLLRVKRFFRDIPVKKEDRPLIGIVGEIFCRLNTFANNELIRHIEAQGGECWLSGVGEWVWYTNAEAFRRHREERRRASKDWLKTFITSRIMHSDEEALMADFHDVFAHHPEPHVTEVLEYAEPYLPQTGALGEMVLSTGRVHLSLSPGSRRRHRHQPLHVHERHRDRGHLSPGEQGP